MRIIGISLVLLNLAVFVAAQKTVVPIVSLSYDETREELITNYGNLLGGAENGKFLDAKTTVGRLKGDTKFSLFNFKSGRKGEFSLGAIRDDGGACPENYYLQPELNIAADFAVGTNANWEILPRQAQNASLIDAVYKKTVADVLRLRGLSKSPVKIKQAVQTDLDGDGKSEVLLVAHHYAEDDLKNAKTGNYSFLIIRKTVGTKTQNIFVGGSFYRRQTDYFDGEYSIAGIADFNGDGKMEVLVMISGYEENWVKVFETKAGKLAEIKALSYYCGA